MIASGESIVFVALEHGRVAEGQAGVCGRGSLALEKPRLDSQQFSAVREGICKLLQEWALQHQ